MKLQLISDLHSEFWDDLNKLYERIQIVPELDFLVIAGDLVVTAKQHEDTVQAAFRYFSSKARHVLYVVGNHEYYGSDRGHTERILLEHMPANFHWLKNTEETIEGVHFYGGPMWFPNVDGLNAYYKSQMNDFNLIRDLETWVYGDNKEFTEKGQQLVRKDTVVVSHHLPHANSTPPQYLGSTLNRFFVSDQTELIQQEQPRLWLHGHTHTPCDYFLGETRVLCNPYGYPRELYATDPYPQVVVDI